MWWCFFRKVRRRRSEDKLKKDLKIWLWVLGGLKIRGVSIINKKIKTKMKKTIKDRKNVEN